VPWSVIGFRWPPGFGLDHGFTCIDEANTIRRIQLALPLAWLDS
jgi:hypothetical protein